MTAPGPGDVVSWQRTVTKGQSTIRQSGFAVVCEIGRGYLSLWPLSGPVTRRLQVEATAVRVLVTADELLTELDRRAAQ